MTSTDAADSGTKITTTTTPSPYTKESPETAQWTKYLPEAFGIRENVRNSPYRWCVRESSLWGIATGTAMSIHRLRMGSPPMFAVNVGFAATLMVCVPSYYFCVRKRDYKERLIEVMMRANDFQEASEMPPEVPAGEEHPFLDEQSSMSSVSSDDTTTTKLVDREFVGHLPERKEWQTQLPQQDAKDVFVEKKRS